jgi:hypothetical protein
MCTDGAPAKRVQLVHDTLNEAHIAAQGYAGAG